MEALLNFAQPLDSELLDRCINAVYTGTPADRDQAQRVLTQLQERINSEDASAALNWFRVDLLLEQGSNVHTKFYALQILDACIKYRWRTLPREQCDGIKNFIVNLVIRLSSDEALLRGNKLFISKLNLILVQVIKQEWPHNWPSFISDVVNASKANETLCENNMAILKILSEEVFDFSKLAGWSNWLAGQAG
ncbi:armadillo-type protein [Pavlovales sp. CCMP2436]|nr:armadillo-type protein [Pavlovales sp. CCMP2436]